MRAAEALMIDQLDLMRAGGEAHLAEHIRRASGLESIHQRQRRRGAVHRPPAVALDAKPRRIIREQTKRVVLRRRHIENGARAERELIVIRRAVAGEGRLRLTVTTAAGLRIVQIEHGRERLDDPGLRRAGPVRKDLGQRRVHIVRAVADGRHFPSRTGAGALLLDSHVINLPRRISAAPVPVEGGEELHPQRVAGIERAEPRHGIEIHRHDVARGVEDECRLAANLRRAANGHGPRIAALRESSAWHEGEGAVIHTQQHLAAVPVALFKTETVREAQRGIAKAVHRDHRGGEQGGRRGGNLRTLPGGAPGAGGFIQRPRAVKGTVHTRHREAALAVVKLLHKDLRQSLCRERAGGEGAAGREIARQPQRPIHRAMHAARGQHFIRCSAAPLPGQELHRIDARREVTHAQRRGIFCESGKGKGVAAVRGIRRIRRIEPRAGGECRAKHAEPRAFAAAETKRVVARRRDADECPRHGGEVIVIAVHQSLRRQVVHAHRLVGGEESRHARRIGIAVIEHRRRGHTDTRRGVRHQRQRIRQGSQRCRRRPVEFPHLPRAVRLRSCLHRTEVRRAPQHPRQPALIHGERRRRHPVQRRTVRARRHRRCGAAVVSQRLEPRRGIDRRGAGITARHRVAQRLHQIETGPREAPCVFNISAARAGVAGHDAVGQRQ